MTKFEFEERVTEKVTDSDYKKIELVYTFHPSINEVDGKDQIAMLFETFGMRIIEDMLPTAIKAMEYEDRIRSLRTQLDTVANEFEEFRRGER